MNRFATALTCALLASSSLCFAAERPAATASERLWYGAAWYPEQWQPKDWEKDLTLMEEAGVNVVRIAEFAWSSLEPEEGRYDFSWMDKAIRMAERHHIKVVIGTPTDTPPAWLTQKYPEVLRIDGNGQRAEHGGRRQFSYASPLYRKFCREIVAKMAARYGRDPNVIGWQIDNELTDDSLDPETRKMFQDFLKQRYGSLDKLNQAWSTAYWSQTYSDWSQIPLTAKAGNPGLMLERKHFVTATWRSFVDNQIDVLRKTVAPGQFITTNVGGLAWTDNWDHYEINRPMDVASWDPYVGQGHLNAVDHAFLSDFVRGWKRQNFWVMETQPGFVNWAPVNNALAPGEVRAMAWESIGHGADAVLFWQWRAALNGQEQYHGTLVGPDGDPVPLYFEFKEIGREFQKTSALLAGTTPQSDVAILTSYDSRWALDFQPHSAAFDQKKVFLDYYAPIQAQTHAVDVVEANAPLADYKIVFAPQLNVISEELAKHLSDYVRNGGTLVLGPRSGMKDEFNRLNVQRQPGPLAGLLGGRVEQFYALDETLSVAGKAGRGTAAIWGEELSAKSPDTDVILSFGKSRTWLSEKPAALSRKVGKGKIVYLGALLDPDLMRQFVGEQIKSAKVAALWSGIVPDGVEVLRRSGKEKDAVIVINHTAAPAKISLPQAMRDALHDNNELHELTLPSQGVAVLETSHAD
jgi:beta-galactosidase